MNWTAIIPLKALRLRKSRLASALSPAERQSLSEAMLAHVENVLRGVAAISESFLLAPAESSQFRGRRILDQGRGLNAEVDAARRALRRRNVLIIHPDLPLLTEQELSEQLDLAVEHGLVIAPDRHGVGTNAVAVRADQPLVSVFGENSAHKFAAQHVGAAILKRPGLAVDVDTPADLDLFRRLWRQRLVRSSPHQRGGGGGSGRMK